MASVPDPQVTTYSDACAVDPQHHVTLYEDDNIRVLRVRYGPQESSAMHGHPSLVMIPVNSATLRRTDSRGRTDIIDSQPWLAIQMSIDIHKYENLADIPFDAVVVEMKYPSQTGVSDLQRRQRDPDLNAVI